MEVCPSKPLPREKPPSLIEIKNRIRVNHSECCNCCCCKAPEFKAYKYIQPNVRKPFAPVRFYSHPEMPMDANTTYNLSFWNNKTEITKPIVPEGCLTVAQGPISDVTTQKMSYLGNWGIKPQEKILPCHRDFFGRGPIQNKTTQKREFTWKSCPKENLIPSRGNLCIPKGCVEDNTTYKLSYFNSKCHEPVKSFAPIRHYVKNDAPVEEGTTYRLSFFSNEVPPEEHHPWKPKYLKYVAPTTPVDDKTTYNLSYWPQCEKPPKLIRRKSFENILNKGPCSDDNTTYGLSYFGGDGDKPAPIMPNNNLVFSDCPISHDTINRMSFMGNWTPKQEKAMMPCDRQLLGRGPIQDETTTKCDYPWKYDKRRPEIMPRDNFDFPQAPLECCTTNRLSFMHNDPECLIPIKSFAPIRQYEPSDLPMDTDTVQQLSYQPMAEIPKVEKPWAYPPPYKKPSTSIEDNTTYNLSYIPPGTIVPCEPDNPFCPMPCSTSVCPQVPSSDTRPCISC